MWRQPLPTTAAARGLHGLLIGHLNRTADCSHTVTFDRKAAKLPGFQLLKGG